jgi:Natural resistance-associated macrophage protein
MAATEFPQAAPSAVLDDAHIGDIRGAFGTIRHRDIAPRRGWEPHARTLLAILGPGLIVMVGDNDAGAFGTYAQAGQDYGTTLLWTLVLLVPVLYVSQEMVLRLGAVTGVGHARLIVERFGRFWGAFSVIDLLLLNALTIVTEFIGISLALGYLGLPRELGVIAAAAVIIAAAGTGDFRRFERFSLLLCFGSLLLVPVFCGCIRQSCRSRMIWWCRSFRRKASSAMSCCWSSPSSARRWRRGSCSFSRATSSTSGSRRASCDTSGPIC